MTRYAVQTDTYSCGWLATVNAKKFQGYRMALRSPAARLLKKALHCNVVIHGTMIYWARRVFRAMRFTRVYRPSIRKLDKVLDRGDAAIVSIYWRGRVDDKPRGHLMLIDRRTPTHYSCVNIGREHRMIKRNIFVRDYWQKWKHGRPILWSVPQ